MEEKKGGREDGLYILARNWVASKLSPTLASNISQSAPVSSDPTVRPNPRPRHSRRPTCPPPTNTQNISFHNTPAPCEPRSRSLTMHPVPPSASPSGPRPITSVL